MVWIAKHFREEHRAALDWLNRSSEPGIRFFGIEVQLFRIGDSPLAPNFDVICRPNDPQKRLTQETSAAVSAGNQLDRDFWTAFIEFCGEQTTFLFPSGSSTGNWMAANLLRSGFGVHLSASKRDQRLECQLWINHGQAKVAFAELLSHKEQIIAALGNQTTIRRNARQGTLQDFRNHKRKCRKS